MSNLNAELKDKLFILTLNRSEKHNAFDDLILKDMQAFLDEAINTPKARAIILRANGKHFSAGADLNWMQRMVSFSQEENEQDAMVLAKVMHTLHTSPKPTLALVQGSAFGGGAGLAAACDIAIAAENARFCFSEVKLGLIPAVISPYVVNAIGARAANHLFISAEMFDAEKAQQLGLVQKIVTEDLLLDFGLDYAMQLTKLAPEAIAQSKKLVADIANQPIDESLLEKTAALIAKKRISAEGQKGLKAFLNKETPNWN
ncbi:MAG: enoyl-CoA hydratase/isomerase family protein [Proteobacteria bacterium]|nr:enoyl-CoA hydratase/isomerase family protein [Pseudomonadota bacterium]